MRLRELRESYNISQLQAATIVGMPLRSYVRYESDDFYGDELKRQFIISKLKSECEIDETKGLLSIDKIKKTVSKVFDNEYKGQIDFCYLFGSYAKGYAKDNSDVDLYVSTSLDGFKFVGLMEKLRLALHKKVDLIKMNSEHLNAVLLKEIMKDGIKIYG